MSRGGLSRGFLKSSSRHEGSSQHDKGDSDNAQAHPSSAATASAPTAAKTASSFCNSLAKCSSAVSSAKGRILVAYEDEERRKVLLSARGSTWTHGRLYTQDCVIHGARTINLHMSANDRPSIIESIMADISSCETSAMACLPRCMVTHSRHPYHFPHSVFQPKCLPAPWPTSEELCQGFNCWVPVTACLAAARYLCVGAESDKRPPGASLKGSGDGITFSAEKNGSPHEPRVLPDRRHTAPCPGKEAI